MRNLSLRESLVVRDCTELSGAQHVCVDYDTKTLYAVTSAAIYGLDPSSQQINHEVSLREAGYTPADNSIRVVGMQHLPDQMAVCVAIETGDVLLWNTTTNQLECVGSVESGLQVMAWSPDHELVLLTTGARTIVIMTRDFDPVTEIPITSDEFGEAAFVTVGWGKKETQFHGTEGKQAASKTADPVKPVSGLDTMRTHVTWRGDGQYFAVSHVNPLTGARQFRVWTREGQLHSTSEAVDGMEEVLSWRPSGALIASCQRKPNKHDIVFFERNGLKHGEFTLPFATDHVVVKELLWNTESTVLAVVCEEATYSTEAPRSFVQLWSMGNYHWYLKQQLEFPGTHQERVAAVCWDPEHGYCLHVVCNGGQYMQYTWSWAVDQSPDSGDNDQALVAVIDGCKLLMTPFRTMVVPPPMSAYSLELPSCVHQVSFSHHGNHLLVALADGRLALYDFSCSDLSAVKMDTPGSNGFIAKCAPPKLASMIRLQWSEDEQDGPFSHWMMMSTDCILFTSCNAMGSASTLHRAEITEGHLHVMSSVEVEGIVLCMAASALSHDVAIQLTDGTVLRYKPKDSQCSPWLNGHGEEVVLGQPCPTMAVCQLAGEEVVLGLTDRFRLFANTSEVASNCTSFAVHQDFLLFTTHAHTCRCVSTNTSVDALASLSDGKSHPFDESVRRVERGSRIVCVVPNDTKLVLQMPRGNLEVIHPRALVLSAVKSILDRLEYKEAFMLMRKHRINMNLLHDHHPATFLDNVARFVEQMKDVNYINLFLTDLQEEDVAETMYTATYKSSATSQQKKKTCKVDSVCDALLSYLEKTEGQKYLLCILTALVKKTIPELNVALQRVKKLKDEGGVEGSKSAEEALKYMLFLVDVNELYDVALGTYDFEIVMMVAQKSQKDPKEYIPFLNSLRQLETHYQRYTIDKYLKRHHSALMNIAKCGSAKFNECVSLVQEFNLYREALALFPKASDEYRVLAECYGDHLLDTDLYEEAGIIYSRAGLYNQALDAFVKSRNWHQCFCVAAELRYSSDQIIELSRTLASLLKETDRVLEAATILEQYTNDIEEAIVTLIEASQWDEALRLMHKYKRTDFIETNLKPSLCCSHGNMVALLTSSSEQVERQTQRLLVVREEKERKRLELLEAEDRGGAESDIFSDTSSATGETGSVMSGLSQYSTDSQMSKASGKSAKNRRKAERKKRSVKEGSAFEDQALIERLHTLYSQADTWRVEVRVLVRALTLFHYDTEACEVQAAYDSLIQLMDQCSEDIWPQDVGGLAVSTAALSLGPSSTANALAQALQQQQSRLIQPCDSQLEPHLRIPPRRNKDKTWRLSIARS